MKFTNRRILTVISIFILTTLSCGVLTSSQDQITTDQNQELYSLPDSSTPTIINPVPEFIDQQDQLVNLYQQVNPGVVAIRVLSEEGSGLGSGFVIDDLGHIITNYHVVRDATELEIDFPSGYKTRGSILGNDLDSDIAVLKVDAPPEELKPLNFGEKTQTVRLN